MAATTINDLPGMLQTLADKVYTLEQLIGSPSVAVGSGSSPTFRTITVGDPAAGTTVVLDPGVMPPSNITAQAGTFYDAIYIDLTWLAPTNNSAVEYEVQVAKKNGDGTYQMAGARRTISTSVRLEGLDPNSTYGVKIYSINRMGQYSTPYPAVGYQDVAVGQDATIPGQVTGLAGVAGATSVTLTWNESPEADVAHGAGQYEVTQAEDAGFSVNVKTYKTSATIVGVAGLDPAITYRFRVRAVDASNNPGPWSATLALQPGSAGGSVTATSDGNPPASSPTPTLINGPGVLMAKWPLVANADEVTYELYLGGAAAFVPAAGNMVGEFKSGNILIRNDPATGAPLVYGTTYYAKVIAKDVDGSAAASPASNGLGPAQVTSGDIAPNSITATNGIIQSLDATKITTGSMSAQFLTANTFTSDKVSTVGLDAAVVKFGVMNGDRIDVNTLSATTFKTSTMQGKTITLASGGQISVGNPGSGTGLLLNDQGIRLYKAGTITVTLDALTGDGTFAGTLNGASGTFTGTITGGTYQTSTSATGDRIVIDSVGGMTLYREATTNYNQQPFFASWVYGGMYQAAPGQPSANSKWGIKYPNNSDWTLSTPSTGNVTYNAYTETNTNNPIGAPYMLTYGFPSTAVAGAYQIYYDVAASAGQWWATSMYQTVSNPTGASTTGWTQFLDANKNVLSSVQYTNIATGGASTSYAAYTWQRNGAAALAPAGTAYVRQLIQAANLTATGSWQGTVYLYGAQIEQKDHVTVYCDGNQYGCTWTGGRIDNISSRPYGSVGHLGIGTGSGPNYINASVYGGAADRVITGYVSTRDVINSQTYAFPYGGGVALGWLPMPSGAHQNPSSRITFIPGDGVWQDYSMPASIYAQADSNIGLGSTQQAGSGNEYPQRITLDTGYTYYAGSGRFARIELKGGSGASGNPYGGQVVITTGGGITYTPNFLVDTPGGYSQFNQRVRIMATGDASVSSDGAGLIIGADGGAQVLIDNNEIVSRNGGLGSSLSLNRVSGGDINMCYSGAAVHNYGELYLDNFPTSSSAGNTYMSSTGRLFRSTSSKKYKKNIKDLVATEAYKILDIRTVQFQAADGIGVESAWDDKTYLWGMIAEEVDAAGLKQFVYYDEDAKPDGVQYDRFVAPLIAVVRDLRDRLAVLEKRGK